MPDFTLLSLYVLCRCPNLALSFMTVMLLITHAITILEKQDLIPYCSMACTGWVFYSWLEGDINLASFFLCTKTSDLCNKWFELFSASVQIQSGLCQWQMASFPQAEKIPFWLHLLKTDERKGQKVKIHPPKYISTAVEINTGTAFVFQRKKENTPKTLCLSKLWKLCLCPQRRLSIC